MINQHYSPLRYPGGKVTLYDFLKNTLKKNKIIDGIYAEGFAGGAGAALKLLMLEDVREIFLNDKDELIFKFWKCILNDTDELLKLIYDTKPSIKEWKFRREVLKNLDIQNSLSDAELGFTAFYLNRVNRSGILKAGVIGGIDQGGNWKIDARFNKPDLIKRIEKITHYKDRIHLYNDDVLCFLKKLMKMDISVQDLVLYLDPPYVIQGKELYRYYFKDLDHKNLAKYLQQKAKCHWITSYDDHPLVHSIYKEVSKNIFEFNYFANRTKIGRELIITSKSCLLPESYFHYSNCEDFNQQNFLKKAI